MELSICIPVYNQDVTSFVHELHRQALRSSCAFEILLMDDCSTSFLEENSALGSLEGVRYVRLPQNVGRSAIRNRLADEARYEYLIFMDCDVFPQDDSFLERYIRMEGHDVVMGGYHYGEQPTSDKHILRWKYGKEREERSAAERSVRPNDSFSTFNFMIRKALFERVRFDESLKGYGHEDTLFGLSLKREGISVTHIDNALSHINYDTSDVFLQKSLNAVANLWLICQKRGYAEDLAESIRILRCFKRIDRFGLSSLFAKTYPIVRSSCEKKLLGKHPSLFIFDLYRLIYLCVCSKK